MKKIITILGALAVASSPTIVLRNTVPHKTQNLQNVLKKASNWENNTISVSSEHWNVFEFSVHLTNGAFNGFSGFLDQISFSLSEYNYHAWPIYLFQWLDDNDFNSPMPDLGHHTKQGFFHDPMPWANRLETYMGNFGKPLESRSDTAFDMSSSWGTWGSFGQTVDNQWNQDRAASKPLIGINFKFGFDYSSQDENYTTETPSFQILMSS